MSEVSTKSVQRSTTSVRLEEEIVKATSTRAFVFTQKRKDLDKAMALLKKCGLCNTCEISEFAYFDFDPSLLSDCEKRIKDLFRYVSRKKIELPLIFVKGNCVGGIKELEKLADNGILKEALRDHDYDLVVIGGGSGGLASAKKAADLEKKVAVFNFVIPSPIGTTWGIGGTCVNVGCIPKKLFHTSALLGKGLEDARKFGWNYTGKATIDWKTLVDAVHKYILSINTETESLLNEKNVDYFNAFASFVSSHKIKGKQRDGKEVTVTADRFLIATGLRPRYLDVPGAKEYCITSDDLFTLPYPPGKTLLMGASYVSLECAGFLHGFGFDVTVMVRSILLRGFDQDMANRVGAHMKEIGIKFIEKAVLTKIEKLKNGKPGLFKVTAKYESGEIIVGEYNTVILAIGRDAVTDNIGLDAIGVERSKTNKKIMCFDNEQSISMPHVYGVGDVLDGSPELTPVAINAGRLLVSRLFEGSLKLCDYKNIPTCVFTPLEYGSCGLSEEEAKEKFGDNVRIYHSKFTPVEFTVAQRKIDISHCYAKVIFAQDETKNERLIGVHIISPNAGEITQGFGVGFKYEGTKNNFLDLTSLHVTCAEALTFGSLVQKSVNPTTSSCSG